MSHIGIIFLLFLIGLDLKPKNFSRVLSKSFWVTVISSFLFTVIGYSLGKLFGFSGYESLIIGGSLCFSSTIIGIKLLPTTVLHHKPVGEIVVSLLLMQDLLAVLMLVCMSSLATGTLTLSQILMIFLSLPLMLIFAFAFVKWIIVPLLERFDRFHEYIFLISLGWCLGLAQFSSLVGLSYEIGAFVAGISMAQSPIAQYITEHLKPLRDFFLILFFFALGAGFNTGIVPEIWLPALMLATLVVVLKPLIFGSLLMAFKENKRGAFEAGSRLGQISEFSLLIAYLGVSSSLIGSEASHVIQATAILTFIASSYFVVFKYPTPIAISDKLRRD